MSNYKERQINIFSKLLLNHKLTNSAKKQIQIFIDLLRSIENIGFDTTSSLFYGFLNNEEFIDSSNCPLTQNQIKQSKEYFLNKAINENRAKQYSLIERISKLPLSSFFGNKLDLKDLALSFLTYASEEKHSTFDPNKVDNLYRYLVVPKRYPNVWIMVLNVLFATLK